MANNKKYYWLKLKNNFFEQKDIKIIEAMDNGQDYIIFLLKLKLRSLEDDGYLRMNNAIPYNNKMLSVLTNTDIDIVRSAMEIFKQFKLIEIMDNDTIYMKCIEKLVGSETDAAGRMRKYRENMQITALNEGQRNNVTPMLQNCSPEKELELELELDKELDIDNTIIEYNQKTSLKDINFERFEQIWNKYPKKIGKKKSFRIFLKTVKTEQDFDNINKAIENYSHSKNVKEGYIKNGQTWFNEWEDWTDFKELGTNKQGFVDDTWDVEKTKEQARREGFNVSD